MAEKFHDESAIDEAIGSTLESTTARDITTVARDLSQYILKISQPPNHSMISQRINSIFNMIDDFLKEPSFADLRRVQTHTANALDKFDQNTALDIQILEQIQLYLDEMEQIYRDIKDAFDKPPVQQTDTNKEKILQERVHALTLETETPVLPPKSKPFAPPNFINSTPLRKSFNKLPFETITEETENVNFNVPNNKSNAAASQFFKHTPNNVSFQLPESTNKNIIYNIPNKPILKSSTMIKGMPLRRSNSIKRRHGAFDITRCERGEGLPFTDNDQSSDDENNEFIFQQTRREDTPQNFEQFMNRPKNTGTIPKNHRQNLIFENSQSEPIFPPSDFNDMQIPNRTFCFTDHTFLNTR